QAARAAHPGAEVLVHPECGCASRLLYRMADGDVSPEEIHIASTEGMINLTRTLAADTYIIATETGIIHRMQQAAPERHFVAADERAVCAYMKTITLPGVRDALALGQFEIDVPEPVRLRAQGAIDRMVSLGD
ncbi:MAG: quinolinate synthase NadA, partial [Gemmatimonadota bacterium]